MGLAVMVVRCRVHKCVTIFLCVMMVMYRYPFLLTTTESRGSRKRATTSHTTVSVEAMKAATDAFVAKHAT